MHSSVSITQLYGGSDHHRPDSALPWRVMRGYSRCRRERMPADAYTGTCSLGSPRSASRRRPSLATVPIAALPPPNGTASARAGSSPWPAMRPAARLRPTGGRSPARRSAIGSASNGSGGHGGHHLLQRLAPSPQPLSATQRPSTGRSGVIGAPTSRPRGPSWRPEPPTARPAGPAKSEEVKAMLHLHTLGWGLKRIAREFGSSRNTVRRYGAAGSSSRQHD